MWRVVLLFMGAMLVLGACGPADITNDTGRAGVELPVNEVEVALTEPYMLEGQLTLRAFEKDRAAAPDTDQAYEFLMANHTSGEMPVVVVLEHQEGSRWRTSLCVENQCLLGDGTEASITDPVRLAPYLELPFQAHIFVDDKAQVGENTTLVVRVEPQVDGIEPRNLTISAEVAAE